MGDPSRPPARRVFYVLGPDSRSSLPRGGRWAGMIQEPSPRDPLRRQFYKMLGPFTRDSDMSSNNWSEFNDVIDTMIPVYDLDTLVRRVRLAWQRCGDYECGVRYVNRSLAAFREHLSAKPTDPPAIHDGGYRSEVR